MSQHLLMIEDDARLAGMVDDGNVRVYAVGGV
jgi:hypothetical protein